MGLINNLAMNIAKLFKSKNKQSTSSGLTCYAGIVKPTEFDTTDQWELRKDYYTMYYTSAIPASIIDLLVLPIQQSNRNIIADKETPRSKKAIEWLSNVMIEAKRVGMQVQFSMEPRNASTDIEKSVESVKAILEQYPMIDAPEFITEEAGGWRPRTTEEETKKVIVDDFGIEYLEDSVVMKPVRKEQSDLAYNYAQIGHNSKLTNHLKENKYI